MASKKKNPLRLKGPRRKPGDKPSEYLTPQKKRGRGTYTNTKDYKYFEGHIVPEVSKQMSPKKVVCWYTDNLLDLRICALNKFWRKYSYCKRCPLFQGDEHAQELRSLIEEWEKDDLEDLEV